MNKPSLPYTDRDAVPLYFFPFLSPRSHTATMDDVVNYVSSLKGMHHPFKGETLLYLHIPFCKNLCYFCGFYRDLVHTKDVLNKYVDALIREIQTISDFKYIQNRKISAVYFGGGTPTILSPELMARLLGCIKECFKTDAIDELSYEGEVRTLMDRQRLAVLRDYGCTRVSFGVQTFDAKVRKLSGLMPTYDDIVQCIDTIREFGYSVNLDLMYGLPGQTSNTVMQDLKTAIDYGAMNIDLYDTVLYPHTTLFKLRHKYKHQLASLHERLDMIRGALKYLSEMGFNQQTVEDFSIPGNEYKMKRLVYGGGDGRSEIIALGAAAVGVVNGYSYRNLPPADYLEWHKDTLALPIQLLYSMTEDDFQKRALVFSPKVLGLKKHFVDPGWLEQYRPAIDTLVQAELLEETETDLLPTQEGLLWTDNIAMTFLDSREQQKIWKIGY